MSKKKMTLTRLTRQHFVFGMGLLVLFALIGVQFVALFKLRHQIAFIDSLEKNNSQVLEDVNKAKGYLSSFGNDLNQIRSFLLLPTQDYDFSEEEEVILAKEEDTASLVFSFVKTLSEYTENQERYQANQSELEAYLAGGPWAEPQFVEEDRVYRLLEGESALVTLRLHHDGRLSARSYSGALELSEVESTAELKTELESFLAGGLEEEKRLLALVQSRETELREQIFPNEALQARLTELGLNLQTNAATGEEELSHALTNADGAEFGKFRILKEDGTLWFNEVALESVDVALEELSDLDTRTAMQMKVDEKVKELDELLTDKALLSLLSAMGWTMGEAIESEDRVSYPILDKEGNVLRLIYVDKKSAEVKVEWPGVSADLLTDAIEGMTSKKKA